MKKHIRINRIITFAFFLVFAVTSSIAMANDSSTPRIPVELKFLGNINDQPVFQLTMAGGTCHNDFMITVRDEYSEILYQERIKSDQFSKKYLLNTEDLGDVDLLFEIFCVKTKQSITYRVNFDTKYVQETTIREIASGYAK